MKLGLVYRGALRTCNYRCGYCPVPRARGSAAEEARDAAGLERLLGLAAARRDDALSILLAPRGEALVHARWRRAVLRLAELPQVRRVAVQTNLSCDASWLRDAPAGKVELWASFHPTETTAAAFARRCAALGGLGVRASAGAVAIPAHLEVVEELRRRLPADVYLWLNRRHGAAPLAAPALARARRIDPWYVPSPPRSRGRPCDAGSAVLFVDGDGTVHRCLGVPAPRGNAFEAPLEALVRPPEPCPAPVCRCWLGWVHLRPLGLGEVFGDGLSRIPRGWPPAAQAREDRP